MSSKCLISKHLFLLDIFFPFRIFSRRFCPVDKFQAHQINKKKKEIFKLGLAQIFVAKNRAAIANAQILLLYFKIHMSHISR